MIDSDKWEHIRGTNRLAAQYLNQRLKIEVDGTHHRDTSKELLRAAAGHDAVADRRQCHKEVTLSACESKPHWPVKPSHETGQKVAL